MAYVPPALRKKNIAASEDPHDRVEPAKSWKRSAVDESGLLNVKDIQNHFWPGREVANEKCEEPGANPEKLTQDLEDKQSFALVHNHSTLNATAEEPDRLKYLLLFYGANPRWSKDKVIFAKTNLQLLQNRTSETDMSPASLAEQDPDTAEQSSNSPFAKLEQRKTNAAEDNPTKANTAPIKLPAGPVQVFEQTRKGHGANFTFSGYYTLTNLEILEPNSPALVRMLDQKWTATNSRGFSQARQRDKVSWKRSLAQQWAVLKFEKDEKSTVELPPPHIEVLPSDIDKPLKGQSVNEMLQELRLKDKKDEADNVEGDREDT